MIREKFNIIQLGYRQRKIRWYLVTFILVVVVLLLCITLLLVGNNIYTPKTVIDVLLGKSVKGASFAIGTLRLPRMLSGLLVGIAFGMSGSTFQTLLRNPLASPDIIGITSGSSVAAVFCILVLNVSGSIVSFAAIVSGLLVALLIYFLSKGGSFSGGRLILIGIGVQAMLRAVISYLLLRASQFDVPSALRWLSGSLNNVRMDVIPRLFIVVLIFGMVIVLFGKHLKILELGEQYAIVLGVRTDLIRLILVLSSVFLIAFATAITGPITFVAFLSGPIATKLVGTGAPNEIPSGLVGAVLVLSADFIAQYAFSVKFPVGVVTGIIGAPYLLLLLIRMNRKGGTA